MSNTARTYPILNDGGQRVRGLKTACAGSCGGQALFYPERCDDCKPVWRCGNCGHELPRRVRRSRTEMLIEKYLTSQG